MRAIAGAIAVSALLLASSMRSPAARPGPPPRMFAFLSHTGGAELDHLRRYGSRISVIAPNWYELRVPAGLLSGAPSPSVIALTHAVGAQLWPVINARLSPGTGIAESRTRGRIASTIAAEAVVRGYDGITLDIEQLPAEQSAAYSALVRLVAARLHAQHERLAVYVPRRTAHGGDQDYDWAALSHSADLLIASGYNEHSASGQPGPVTSTAGFGQMLDYAARISRASFAPALGAFGYSWPLGGGAGELISTLDAERWRHQAGAATHIVDGDVMFRAGGRIVYYQEASALHALASAARARRMRWLALFSLGREPDAFWAHLRTARQAAGQRHR